ncbi:hypothetical protein [Bacillus sp. M6-12]|uniref:hypothetical protein n=1 Tax=Bacillus sp. M6-12 TaxID=2054166 RepID=UPI0015E100B0|nr:hypothetical protein [Bacillus sp. M6-12]
MANVVTSFKEVNNLGFDVEKTEELVAGLQREGAVVGIEDLSSYIRKQGLIVSEHIGRRRNYVKVSPKLFGVDLTTKGTETNEFFKQHMKMGKITFLPEAYETELINIESTVRVQRKRNSIGYDNKFMTIDSYNAFMEMVNGKVEKQIIDGKEVFVKIPGKKEEYFATRDKIVANWDTIIARFKEIVWISLDELNALDKDKVFNTIMSRIPSKEEYANSFYMTIGAKAFPVTENLSMFDEDIQKQINEGLNQETVQTLYEIIGNTLNDAFENVCRVINTIKKNDKIAIRTLGSVKNTAKRIAQKNIFNNPKIDAIRDSILEMLNLSVNPEAMCEEAEAIASMIYGYAKELGIEDTINLKSSPLSEDELLELFEMIEGKSFDDEDEIVAEEMYKMRA